ncbi:MAG: nucleotide exchange factor GrpE [Defluviitaleaceae bacterium]|nr:nucleotide exchange factor GrpE [Defluviitaleaceae bacterium]
MSKRHKQHMARGEADPAGQDFRDHLNGLVTALDELERFGGALVDKFAARVVAQMGKNISYKIVMSGIGARLNSFDEKSYEAYAALMGRYKDISELYGQVCDGIMNENTRRILDGVISIISSRVKFAEENGGISRENPVNAEKNKLVTGLLQEFYKECKLVAKDDFFAEVDKVKERRLHTLAASPDIDAAHAAFADVVSRIDKLSRPIYPIYQKKCQSLVAALNDLNLRTSASYYFRLIETEKDIIESIVKIQLSALDREYDPVESGEGRLLQAIRECYQMFMKDACQILDGLRGALGQDDESRTSAESYENYQADLVTKLSAEQAFPAAVFEQASQELPTLLRRYGQELEAALHAIIENKIAKARLDRTLYELRKNVTQSTLMANEMTGVFRAIHKFYQEHEEYLASEPGIEIISGIHETIGIKIMNIQDGKAAFYEDALQKLENCMLDGRGLCETALENIRAEAAPGLLETLLAAPPDSLPESLEKAFDAAFERSFAQKIDKATASWQTEINRHITAFKREVLLYEMGTFDEIMNFSVSKLVEDSGEEQSPSLAYAAHLKRAQGELVEILGRNGISRIMPHPHDPFDGKEHDVLMAERTEGFAKGEIVKTFSSGYRERDTVLVRASVIAAK